MGLLRRVARARLAGQVVRRLRRAGLADARYDARGFQVRFTADADAVPTILELAPLLAARGATRRKRVDDYVAGLLLSPGLPREWGDVRPLLRPVLRGGTPGAPLRRPVLPYLSEMVVIDQPETMTYVVREQLAAWGVTAEEVFTAARANLSGAVLQGAAADPVVVRFVDDGDAYWTSHLLLPHWLERLTEQVGGPPVAFAPERGTLLVTADGCDHLPGLFALAEEIYARSSRPITPMAYASDENGCTVPYAAPEGHPLRHAVQRAACLLAIQEYARQAPQLKEPQLKAPQPEESQPEESHLKEPHLDPTGGTVVELVLTGSDATGWRTRAIWERNEPALLPTADEVLVGDAPCPWAEIAPGLTAVPGLDPIRWSAPHWPTAKRSPP